MIETIPTEFGELTELQGLYLSKTHVAAKQMIFCVNPQTVCLFNNDSQIFLFSNNQQVTI